MRAQLHGDCAYQLHGEPNGREFAIGTSVGDSSEVLRDQRIDERWSRDIRMEGDGSFDLLLSAQEQPGNWLPLRPGVPCVVGIRQYFVDWTERSIPGFFYVTRIDGPATPDPVLATLLAHGHLFAASTDLTDHVVDDRDGGHGGEHWLWIGFPDEAAR
jgi:hypothetical protein